MKPLSVLRLLREKKGVAAIKSEPFSKNFLSSIFLTTMGCFVVKRMTSKNQQFLTSISKPRNVYEKHVISTPLNSIAFQRKSINTLSHASIGKTMILVVHRLSIRHHNNSYGFESNNKNRQKPKIQQKSARRNCLSHLNQKSLSENFFYDPLNVCSKQMRNISIIILYDFQIDEKINPKIIKKLWKLVASKSWNQ